MDIWIENGETNDSFRHGFEQKMLKVKRGLNYGP